MEGAPNLTCRHSPLNPNPTHYTLTTHCSTLMVNNTIQQLLTISRILIIQRWIWLQGRLPARSFAMFLLRYQLFVCFSSYSVFSFFNPF
jgi:hypothetical protein